MNHEIEKLLPHRSPMLLITAIESVDFDGKELVARIDVSNKDIMYQRDIDGVPSCAALEYMAQSIGCYIGLEDLRKDANAAPVVGFVLGSRSIDINVPFFKTGESYFVHVNSLYNDNNIASFECKIYNQNKECLAKGALNVFRPDDITTFMEGRNE